MTRQRADPSWYVAGFNLGTELGSSATQSYTFTVKKVGITQVLPS